MKKTNDYMTFGEFLKGCMNGTIIDDNTKEIKPCEICGKSIKIRKIEHPSCINCNGYEYIKGKLFCLDCVRDYLFQKIL